MKKTLLSWSSGKDSAWALYLLQKPAEFEVTGLFTTINRKYNRAAIHSTRLELPKKQSKVASLPLRIIELPYSCSNEEYRNIMKQFVLKSVAEKVECMAFGDLFLEHIREDREKQLENTGIKPNSP